MEPQAPQAAQAPPEISIDDRPDSDRMSTGIPGLDAILHGGLIRGRSYLVRGPPGCGKTIFGYHFLLAGIEADETPLLVSLEESAEDLQRNAKSIGLDLSAVEILDLSPGAEPFTEGGVYDVFSPEDVEHDEISQKILEAIKEVEPDRVFLDPVTQLRYLTLDDYQFRKQVTGFKRFVSERGTTAVFTSQTSSITPDDDLQFLTDGTIDLRSNDETRIIAAPKFRGSATRGGRHTYRIGQGGIRVFPELEIGDPLDQLAEGMVSSGVPELDEILHGGLERGTTTIISGPTGVGKTTTGAHFMKEAAGRGEHSVIYLFEEGRETFLKRCKAVNIPVADMLERGTLTVEQVEALQRTPEELGQMMRKNVEEEGASIVMIDGISGYKISTRGDHNELVRPLHALCRYLTNQGVTVLLVDEVATVGGAFQATETGLSYLADNILVLRHVEHRGELRKVIGVLKKRLSDFDSSLRPLDITQYGVKVGTRIEGLQGLLSGSPQIVEGGRSGGEPDSR